MRAVSESLYTAICLVRNLSSDPLSVAEIDKCQNSEAIRDELATALACLGLAYEHLGHTFPPSESNM